MGREDTKRGERERKLLSINKMEERIGIRKIRFPSSARLVSHEFDSHSSRDRVLLLECRVLYSLSITHNTASCWHRTPSVVQRAFHVHQLFQLLISHDSLDPAELSRQRKELHLSFFFCTPSLSLSLSLSLCSTKLSCSGPHC